MKYKLHIFPSHFFFFFLSFLVFFFHFRQRIKWNSILNVISFQSHFYLCTCVFNKSWSASMEIGIKKYKKHSWVCPFLLLFTSSFFVLLHDFHHFTSSKLLVKMRLWVIIKKSSELSHLIVLETFEIKVNEKPIESLISYFNFYFYFYSQKNQIYSNSFRHGKKGKAFFQCNNI